MSFGFAFPMSQLFGWAGLFVSLLAALAYVLLRLERSRESKLGKVVDLALAPRLLSGHDPKLRRPLFWFTLAGFAAVALALAQPHWGQSWQEIQRRSHDVLVLLDTSESMLAENPLPNRLVRAKQKIESILERTPGDRFGLIAFSGGAELMCPLTHDIGYFKAVLNAVDTDSISLEGTDIAAAIRLATDTFRDQAEETGDYTNDARAILLISDGEQVSGDAVAAAADASKLARIFVIGVGDPRGTEVTYSSPFGRRMPSLGAGGTHLSKLDEETLTRIAIEGGGGYKRSTPGNADVDDIYGLIEQLSTRLLESDVRFQLVNRYQWPLAFAILCFASEGLWLALLPRIRRRRQGATNSRERTAAYE